MATTTIAVKDTTRDMLSHAKEQLHAETLDETIHKLVLLLKKPKKSMCGIAKGVKNTFKREKLDRFT